MIYHIRPLKLLETNLPGRYLSPRTMISHLQRLFQILPLSPLGYRRSINFLKFNLIRNTHFGWYPILQALLYVAAEDEAFLAFNREMDARSFHDERKDTSSLPDGQGWDSVEAMPMDGKNINEWLAELDSIAKEVEAELVSREIGCDLVEVLEAVNKVLFECRGFKRLRVLVDSKGSYLHSVLSSGGASGMPSPIHILLFQKSSHFYCSKIWSTTFNSYFA